VTKADHDSSFTQYAESALPRLRPVAHLPCRDWHRADDLVQTSAVELYVHCDKASQIGNVDGYLRTILVNTFIEEQRTTWWKRISLHHEQAPDPAAPEQDLAGRLDLREALAGIPARQRATLVLRYYCELSVEETAQTLGCSVGTVKSQTSRGLGNLRRAIGGRTEESADSVLLYPFAA
jgi:RNA polymerase sigma-70 factor (sigma-E family)